MTHWQLHVHQPLLLQGTTRMIAPVGYLSSYSRLVTGRGPLEVKAVYLWGGTDPEASERPKWTSLR